MLSGSLPLIWKKEMVTRYHSLSLVVTLVITRCHSLYHSLSFVVTCCTTRCTTRCHSLSLVVTRCTTSLSFYKRSNLRLSSTKHFCNKSKNKRQTSKKHRRQSIDYYDKCPKNKRAEDHTEQTALAVTVKWK